MSSIAWRPTSFDTDEEDEVALVPTSSPGRKLLALLDDMSMSGIARPTSTGDEEADEAAHGSPSTRREVGKAIQFRG